MGSIDGGILLDVKAAEPEVANVETWMTLWAGRVFNVTGLLGGRRTKIEARLGSQTVATLTVIVDAAPDPSNFIAGFIEGISQSTGELKSAGFSHDAKRNPCMLVVS
jgi:hypothetical protein